MKRAGMAIAALGVLVFLGIWIKGLLISEEDRVRDVIHRTMDTIERRAALDFGDHLHPKYRDAWRMDRQTAKQVIYALRQMFAELQIEYTDIDVTVTGETATALFQAKAKVKTDPGGNWIPLDQRFGQLRDPKFEVRLLKREGEWLIKWAGHPEKAKP